MEVKVGQVWADNDSRLYGQTARLLRVESIVSGWAVVRRIDIPNGRQTTIRLDRFKPTTTGYRFMYQSPPVPVATASAPPTDAQRGDEPR